MGRQSRVAALAIAATVALYSGAGAQNLAVSLFERYLEPLRVQAGIPGLSAAIVQDRQIVWERGLGFADVEASIAARADTPYGVADLTQTFTAILLGICAERGLVQPDYQLRSLLPQSTETSATLRQFLTHTSGPTGAFRYEPARFALLTGVVELCAQESRQGSCELRHRHRRRTVRPRRHAREDLEQSPHDAIDDDDGDTASDGDGLVRADLRRPAADLALRPHLRRVLRAHPEGAVPPPDVGPGREQRRLERRLLSPGW
jgi:hypothetical protein